MKEPFAFSVSDPCSGAPTSRAVVPGVSLARTDGRSWALVSMIVSSFVAYASSIATTLLKRRSSIAKESRAALLGQIWPHTLHPHHPNQHTKIPDKAQL